MPREGAAFEARDCVFRVPMQGLDGLVCGRCWRLGVLGVSIRRGGVRLSFGSCAISSWWLRSCTSGGRPSGYICRNRRCRGRSVTWSVISGSCCSSVRLAVSSDPGRVAAARASQESVSRDRRSGRRCQAFRSGRRRAAAWLRSVQRRRRVSDRRGPPGRAPELSSRLVQEVTPDLLRRVGAHELAAAVVMESHAAARRQCGQD